MAILDTLRSRVLNWLMAGQADGWTDVLNQRQTLLDYYQGQHKRPLKVKPLQQDHNLTVNFVGLVVERATSMLMGPGVEFEFGEGEDAAEEQIEAIYKANSKNILFHRLAQSGAIYGTVYVKIMPDFYGPGIHRLVALDPKLMEVETNAEDMEQVERYVMRYTIGSGDGAKARVEITQRNESGTWEVQEWESDRTGRMVLTDTLPWPYDFPPIHHWQNLPEPGNVYGQSDISDVIEIQDRLNFVAANVSKIISIHASPRTWGRGTRGSDQSWGPDQIVWLAGQDAMVQNLEMQSDLTSSMAYIQMLRQALFDVARTVDISSMADKIGSLTNFGLRVLYMDAVNKTKTKQLLYGDGLQTINRRCLALNGIDSDGGTARFGDALPVNDLEAVNTLQSEIGMGLLSKASAAQQRGYDYDDEQEKIQDETSGNIGAALLAFNQGR